jgi:predicted helicase
MKISNIFNKINNWNDFNDALIPLNNKEKGDAFELLCELYFTIDHKYDNYDNIWLLSEVPKKELEIIGLESRDLGIDLIAKKGAFMKFNILIHQAKGNFIRSYILEKLIKKNEIRF